MTSNAANATRPRLFPDSSESPSKRSGARIILAWWTSCLVIFWATFACTLVAIAWLSLTPRQQSFDTGGARQVWRIGTRAYEAQFPGRLPPGCVVGCAGLQLTEAATAEEVVRQAGRYWIDADRGIVRWSPQASAASPHTPIPMAVLVVPGKMPPVLGRKLLLFWIPAAFLATVGLVLAIGNRSIPLTTSQALPKLLVRSLSAFTFVVPASVAWRTVVVLAVEFGLALALIPDWNCLITCPDSRSYVENWRIRTPLTARWIALFDSNRNEPRTGSVPAEHRTIAHWGASHRYVNAVRAWKLLLLVSVCVCAWWLTSFMPWWMAAPFILAAASFDASRGLWSSGMSGYLDVILSEPLSYSLLLLLLASLCAYLARPGCTRGLAMVACLTLLVLARPASVVFTAVIGCVWFWHRRRDGLGIACWRAGSLAVLFMGAIALHCTWNRMQHGHFRQHAFTGMNLMTTALEVADPDDAGAFADPSLSRYAQLVIGKARETRRIPFDAGAADANCWQIAVPAYTVVYGASAEEEPFEADEVLTCVARTIIRRHPREFFELAWSSFRSGFWRTWIHVPLLLTGAAAFGLFWRTRNWPFLFVAFLAIVPFVGIIPACVTNYPIDRYRSLTSFAEIWSLPLLIGAAIGHFSNRSVAAASIERREERRGFKIGATPQCGYETPYRFCA